MNLHELTPEKVATLFNGNVFPLGKPDCFNIINRGHHIFGSEIRYNGIRAQGCSAPQAELLMLIRASFFSVEAFDAMQKFVQSDNFTLKQKSVGDRAHVEKLLMCITECISAQVFTSKQLYDAANMKYRTPTSTSQGVGLFFKRWLPTEQTGRRRLFQQATSKSRDVLLVISAMKDVLGFFACLGNNPLWTSELKEKRDWIRATLSEESAMSGSRNSNLEGFVGENVHIMFGVLYCAFLYQFQIMAIQLGKIAFSNWCREWIQTIHSLSSDKILLAGFNKRPNDIGSFSEGGHESLDPRKKGSKGSYHKNGQLVCCPDFACMTTIFRKPDQPASWNFDLSNAWCFGESLQHIFKLHSATEELHHPVASDPSVKSALQYQDDEERAVNDFFKGGGSIEMVNSSSTTLFVVSKNGLENPRSGRRCWLNTMLQIIANMPCLQDYLGGRKYLQDLDRSTDPRKSVTVRVAAHIRYSLGSRSTMTGQTVLELLEAKNMVVGQQDMHEKAFLPLIGGMEEEANAGNDIITRKMGVVEVVETLGKCSNCTNEIKSRKMTPTNAVMLKVPDERRCTLLQCLGSLSQPQTIKYRCEKCGTYVDATQTMRLGKRPEYLVLIMNKTRVNNGVNEKSDACVKLALDNNDLSHVMVPTPEDETAVASYDLLAIGNHHGNQMESGHYTATVREFPSRNFYSFDDSRCEQLPETEVVNPNNYLVILIRSDIAKQLVGPEGSSSDDDDDDDDNESTVNGEEKHQRGGDSCTGEGGTGTGMSGERSVAPHNLPVDAAGKKNLRKRPRPTKYDGKNIRAPGRLPQGAKQAMAETFNSAMKTLAAVEAKIEDGDIEGIEEDDLRDLFSIHPDLWAPLCDFVRQSYRHMEKYKKMCGDQGESNDEEPSRQGQKDDEDKEQESSDDESSASKDEVQNKDSFNNNVHRNYRGKGLASSHKKKPPPSDVAKYFDLSAVCDDDSQQEQDSVSNTNASLSDSFIEKMSSERREEKRRRLSNSDSSSSEEGDMSNTMEEDSPDQRTDVAPGKYGLPSPIANKEDMVRRRELGGEDEEEEEAEEAEEAEAEAEEEAEDERSNDANQSSSLQTESNQQQNRIDHNSEEQTVGALHGVAAETELGVGGDGINNSRETEHFDWLALAELDDFADTDRDRVQNINCNHWLDEAARRLCGEEDPLCEIMNSMNSFKDGG